MLNGEAFTILTRASCFPEDYPIPRQAPLKTRNGSPFVFTTSNPRFGNEQLDYRPTDSAGRKPHDLHDATNFLLFRLPCWPTPTAWTGTRDEGLFPSVEA